MYSSICDDTGLYIVVSIESDRLKFTHNPTLMFKNFNGDI